MPTITTGGTYTFNQTAVEIVSFAYRRCQVIGEEETATGFQLQEGLDTLNAMAKGLQASGIHLWCEEECILFPQQAQPLYQIGPGSPDHACLWDQFLQGALAASASAGAGTVTLRSAAGIVSGDTFGVQLDAGTNFWTAVNGAPVGNVVTLANTLPSSASVGAIAFDYSVPLMRPLRVPGARRYIYASKIETPMLMLARLQYQNLPNKYTSGVITQAFFDPQTGQGQYSASVAQLSLWPNPSDFTSGVRFTAQRPIQDFQTLADIPDFPVEWLPALKWNLALELGPSYGVPAEQMGIIEKRAGYWLGLVQSWDREPEAIRFGVAMAPGYAVGG